LIQQAAKLYNIDANLVRAVIKVESNYHPRAISSAGAKGLMQLMPTISKELEVSDLFEPRQNIMAGTRYLRMLINQFKGNHKLVLAAYHAGPGIVSRRNAIPYKTTERYVRRVVSEWLRYRAAGL
jgi:soluble lytic murein transglycosylase-like protein